MLDVQADGRMTEKAFRLPNSSSCIDLVFTSDSNMLRESGVYSWLHPNCHYQIVFAEFNLKIYYPSPYERLAWQYQKTNSNLNQRVTEIFDWSKAFENKDVDRQADNLMRLF